MGKKLTVALVRGLRHSGRGTRPEKHYDEHGLFVQVTRSGGKQFVQRLVVDGKRRDLGLGGFPVVSLAEAREMAWENRRAARRGEAPPVLARRPAARPRSAPPATAAAEPQGPAFAAAFERVIELRAPSWKESVRASNVRSWRAQLRDYLGEIAGRPVASLTSADLLEVVAPLWGERNKTARKLLDRVGMVLRWAITEGLRTDDPVPALLRTLPKPKAAPSHFRALPYTEIPGLLVRVRASGAPRPVRLSFEWMLLTAVRSREAQLTRFEEISGDTWTIPAVRMKATEHGDHRVPLPPQALAVVREAGKGKGKGKKTGLVFPGRGGGAVAHDAFRALMRSVGANGTPHGCRTGFSTWAQERGVADELITAALAHVKGSTADRAYLRSDIYERRAALAAEWAAFCTGEAG